jgi:hypothetical protein
MRRAEIGHHHHLAGAYLLPQAERRFLRLLAAGISETHNGRRGCWRWHHQS